MTKSCRKIYERVLFSALVVEEYFLKDPRTYMWPYQRFKLAQNIGKILATLSMKGIGTEQDLIYAHYSSTWIKMMLMFQMKSLSTKYLKDNRVCRRTPI